MMSWGPQRRFALGPAVVLYPHIAPEVISIQRSEYCMTSSGCTYKGVYVHWRVRTKRIIEQRKKVLRFEQNFYF